MFCDNKTISDPINTSVNQTAWHVLTFNMLWQKSLHKAFYHCRLNTAEVFYRKLKNTQKICLPLS